MPRDRIVPFIDDLRALFRAQDVNLVNASIRAVDAEHNALSYAPNGPAFSVVLYLNQSTDAEGNARMARLTSDLIDLTARHGGRFFLPYQLAYTPAQLERSYPEIRAFFAAKRQWDPQGTFSNSWYAVTPRPCGAVGKLKAAGRDPPSLILNTLLMWQLVQATPACLPASLKLDKL